MNFQPYQLLMVFGYIFLGFLAYKAWDFKTGYVFGAIIALMLTVFFVNPFRFAQNNVGSLEVSISRFDDIPDKVEVKTESFDDSLKREINNLRQQSEERKDEIHN